MPNMNLYICKGIPTDKTYNHVLRFQSDSSRFDYFTSKSVLHLTNYTYQRIDHYLSVGVNAEAIEPCNYIVFQNADFSSKWYYAFIDRVEYVANETSRIYFTLDVMQTWFPYCTVLPCFIERMHTNTDNIGDNIIDDNLDTGPYIDNIHQSIRFVPKIVFMTTFDSSYKNGVGKLDRNIYTGLVQHVFSTADEANAFLSGAVDAGVSDGIVSCYMSTGTYGETTVNVPIPTSVDGYVPKNKKLFTYPYCYERVFDNANQMNGVFRYELFNGNSRQLKVYDSDGLGNPEIGAVPLNYSGTTSDTSESWVNGSFCRPWPVCSYNTDIYKAYMAQNSSAVGVENLGMVMSGVKAAIGIAGMIGSTATFEFGKAVDQGIGAINEGLSIANVMAKRDDMDRLPPQAHGTPSGSIAYQFATSVYVHCSSHHVTAEYARMIDNYWSVYGYPIREVQTPNIDSRSNWNYIKTGNSCIRGEVPSESLDIINAIFNRGVTFWHNPNTLGNYSLDNNIVG